MEKNAGNEIRIGVAGAGGFAQFAVTAFAMMPGVRVAAVMDTNPSAAQQLAGTFNAVVYNDYQVMIADESLHAIYIATPPFLHYEQSRKALLAGKHVICEKPAALHLFEAEELVMLAKQSQLLYVVNLMQRYNPLYAIVRKIKQERLMGRFLHGYFENYASSENLFPDHWFWNPRKSGGIFIEHAVHFFDLFSGWLGEGKLLHAVQLKNEQHAVDRVQATVLYKEGLVNFYHGFNQLNVLDRQEMRLQFELGDITLHGWIPVECHIRGFLCEEAWAGIRILMNEHIEQPPATHVSGMLKEMVYLDRFSKQERYRQMLGSMISDQVSWIYDHAHTRLIDDRNAVESVGMADLATVMSKDLINAE